MKKNITRYLVIAASLMLSQLLQGCLFEYISQPSSAKPGDIIDIEIAIQAKTVDANAHKGIVGILVPQDWTFISAAYSSDVHNGEFIESEAWKDSVEQYHPSEAYGDGMKWFVLISDSAYTNSKTTTYIVNVKMQAGETEGCFDLAYLTTKATADMLENPSWAPVSYPHPIGIPDSNLCQSPYEVRQAPEWDNILDRTNGWTGADGIYTIPLNEVDKQGEGSGKQLMVFSDTFIGQVNSSNARVNAKIVNNTYAVLQNPEPVITDNEFFWSEENGTLRAVFKPETPTANSGDWYWLMDGISLNDTIYVFALRLNSTGGGSAFSFEVNGVALLKFNLDENNEVTNAQQFDTPLYYKDESENWDIVLGQAIVPMTEVSGNPSPDGYIYVYGPKDNGLGKQLAAARVMPENIENFDKWEYWDGTGWGNNIANCASITPGISQEFSITPLSNGEFLLVAQTGSNVAVKTGESPVGPFGIFRVIYKCPEVAESANIFVYNAKAHPSLSAGDELLISYNVNSMSLSELVSNADIYRPRFIYLKINDSTGTDVADSDNLINGYKLGQNYPNPFNPVTTISFRIGEPGMVKLEVFDILGRKAAVLADNYLQSGEHIIKFDASSLSSGVYFYRLSAGAYKAEKKLVLLK
jgi:hypothetical protein